MLRVKFAIDSYLAADDALATDLARQLSAVDWADYMLALFVERANDPVHIAPAAA
jgi:hypothetical protein